jgi:hypothetical protein
MERFDGRPPATEDAIRGLEPHALPGAYLAFLRRHDGGKGFIGSVYVILWGTAELAEGNIDYEVAALAPGYVLFGTDGGSEGFAFDTKTEGHPVVMVSLVSLDRKDAIHVGDHFDDFVDRLSRDVSLIPTR